MMNGRKLCAVLVGICACRCGVYERARQIRTHSNMQIISAYIREETASGASPSVGQIEAAINRVSGGVDQWGQKFQYVIMRLNDTDQYLLVSTGADRKPDVSQLTSYFGESVENVAGKYDRDIVFLNGVPLKGAGK